MLFLSLVLWESGSVNYNMHYAAFDQIIFTLLKKNIRHVPLPILAIFFTFSVNYSIHFDCERATFLALLIYCELFLDSHFYYLFEFVD